jgi:hypothetical protein
MVPLDALRTLLASLRAAGGTLRRQDDALLVRFGRLDAAEREAVTVLLRRHKPAVLALLDVEAVFPGALVIACSICGGTEWRQAGAGEVCEVCHPAPGRASGGALRASGASSRRRRIA